eukprot:TRINITY_DN1004_c0_g1_i2.p1 TRINITY_DN1004_c0_g1~~TRINITY_DN1004_c0_g1_i2.p1  ORF type:complete len:978 (-),score=184.65 TRINITY_DN1004_c0_g1_i2:806-3739(-)
MSKSRKDDHLQEAIELINGAKLSEGEPRAKLLNEVREIVIEKAGGDAAIPATLPSIVDFRADRNQNVRKAVAGLIDDMIGKRPDQFVFVIAALIELSNDDAVLVKKRAMISATNVLRHALQIIAKQKDNDLAVAVGMLAQLRSVVLAHLDSPNEGVRHQAIKFAEVVLLLFSDAGTKQATFNLSDVPVNHPFLNRAALIDESTEILARLKSLCTTNSAGTLGMLANSLANVAKQRPNLVQDILPALLSLPKAIDAIDGALGKSVHHTLKTALLTLMKNSMDVGVIQALDAVLTDMGAIEQVTNTKKALVKAYPHLRQYLLAPQRKRPLQESTAPESKRPSTATSSAPSSVSLDMLLSVSRLPDDDVVDMVLKFYGNAPISAASSLTELQPMLSNLLGEQVAVSFPGRRRDPRVRSGAAASAVVDVAMPDVKAPMLKVELPQFQPKTMSMHECQSTIELCFHRILETEDAAAASGASRLRAQMLIRLVSVQDLNGGMSVSLRAHILDDVVSRVGIAQEWLMHELTNAIRGNDLTRYNQLTELLVTAAVQQKHFAEYILLAVPVITDAVLTALMTLIRAKETCRKGLLAAKDIVLLVPPACESVLHLLLTCTHDDDDDLRSLSIRLIGNVLYPQERLVGPIESFATAQLDALLENTELSEEDAGRHMVLYVGLCTKQFRLMQGLMERYTRLSVNAKRALHKQASELVQSIPDAQARFAELATAVPVGSEQLLSHCLHLLTDTQSATPQLVSAAYKLYRERKDARLVIPIVAGLAKPDVIRVLPDIVALPSSMMKLALQRLSSPQSQILPSDVMIALHLIDTSSERPPIKAVIEATTVCFENTAVFTQEVLAVALQQMVDMSPVPPLFVRSLMQTLTTYPQLMQFIMSILSKLVTQKQVWLDSVLWNGFLRCCQKCVPHSYEVLLQLQPAQLEEFVGMYPKLRGALLNFALQRRTPNSLIAVLRKPAAVTVAPLEALAAN